MADSYHKLVAVIPVFAAECKQLLLEQNKVDLANQIESLNIVKRCSCTDDFCASFSTHAQSRASFGGSDRYTLDLNPEKGMILMDIADGKIIYVEVLYRDDVRSMLSRAFS